MLFIFLGAIICATGFTQNEEEKENTFSIGIQQRSRAELRAGAYNPLANDDEIAALINNRSRITMEYKREKLSLSLSAQHVGVWGQDTQNPTDGRAMFNEAWTNLMPVKGLFLKIGRQSLIYDDERLLGGLDWHVSGRYHDALKMGYENEKNKVHLILAFNQDKDRLAASSGTYYSSAGQPYKIMHTAWYQLNPNEVFNISFLAMNLGFQTGVVGTAKMKYMQTVGTNLSIKPGDFQLYGNFYLQTGKTKKDKNIAAFMWTVNASFKLSNAVKLTAGSDYLSGDNKKTPKYEAFDVLYGTHHKYYGNMDYYYPNDFSYGLWDNQIGVSVKTSSKFNFSVICHIFQSTTDIKTDKKDNDRFLGQELDFQLAWNIMKDVTLSGGYSAMLISDAVKVVKNKPNAADLQDWMWVSLNINPKVFISKW